MDLENKVINLCIAGTQAEYEGGRQDAAKIYTQAWDVAENDYKFCIAAHYVARFQAGPRDSLRWNHLSLEHANLVNDARVADFYPSLYLNIGWSYERLGNLSEATMYYKLASDLGVIHQPD